MVEDCPMLLIISSAQNIKEKKAIHAPHRSKMGPKPAAVLLLLSIIYLSLAMAGSNHLADPVEDDSNHLAKPLEDDSNQMDIDQVEHQLVKREAGRGRKKSCEGKRWVVWVLDLNLFGIYWVVFN